MKENWTKQMKQKLEGHKMTPPAGLLEAISSEMNLEPTPAHKLVAIRRWIWAAAAAVLAIAGFFAFYQFDESETKLEANNNNNVIAASPVNEEAKSSNSQSADAEEPSVPSEPMVAPKHSIASKPKLLALATTDHKDEAIVEQSSESEQPSEQANLLVSDDSETTPATEKHQPKQTYLPEVIEPTSTASQSSNSDKWTIGVTGSNGLLLAANDYANSINTQPLYNDVSPADYLNSYTPKNEIHDKDNFASVYTTTDVEAKHHIPLRLGLSLQYQLNNRLALLSGISYTYLKSEFSVPQHSNLDYDQELNYVGIPVGLSYKLLASEHFNIYVAGGTLIEKCVSANSSSDENIKSRPWQWSISASAGAEYNFTRQFGLYLEPSLGYYFNDGTSLQHYYKEHPLAPSVQFGLRLHLK